MKRVLKNALYVLFFAAFAAMMAVLVNISRSRYAQLDCNSVEVIFTERQNFVTEADVNESIVNFYGQVIGMRLIDIDLLQLEDILETKSAVKGCEAWVTSDGVLHLSVSERRPVVKFIQKEDGFFTDETGFVFPLNPRFDGEVPTVSCPLAKASDEEWRMQMIKLVSHIGKTGNWAGRISEIRAQSNGEVEFRTPEKGATILFGTPDRILEKFSLMDKYYDQIIPQKTRTYYKTVNVKYNNQIICRKD